MHDSASKHISNWSITFASDDDVEWITTSAACSRTSFPSAETFTPHGASCAPTTSPTSRPTLAGSISMAPIISIACFSRIRRAMDAPMGPTPYWMARIFFFTSFSTFHWHARTTRILASKETLTIMEFPCAFNEEPFDLSAHAEAGPAETDAVAGAGFAPHNVLEEDNPRGGSRHARQKTHRRRNHLAAAQGKRLERGERQAAP